MRPREQNVRFSVSVQIWRTLRWNVPALPAMIRMCAPLSKTADESSKVSIG